MTICQIVENPQMSEELFDRVSAHVRSSGPVPPEGGRLVLGGPAGAGYRVITVWDSGEARDRFLAERLRPAYKEAGLSLDDATLTEFEVTTLVAGDLTGTPAPA